MRPHPINPCTRVMGAPAEMADECGDLQISDQHDAVWGNCMHSAWLPSPEEREAILNGQPIILRIVGTRHPVVAMWVGDFEGVDGTRDCGNVPCPKHGV